MKKAMHANSLAAFEETEDLRGHRAGEVHATLLAGGPMTDRQVMAALGFTDPNQVRPRITELKDADWVIEVGKAKDPETGKTVRVVRALDGAARRARIEERRRRNALDFPTTETQADFLGNLATA
jgi:hypothetical protein